MSLPNLPTFPEDLPEIKEESFEKIARNVLILLPSTTSGERVQRDEDEMLSRDLGFSVEEMEKVVAFLKELWKYIIYHRLAGESLLNVLERSLPSSCVDVVSNVWYSEGARIYTYFARRTASDKPRVKDISWSVWKELSSNKPTKNDGDFGVQLSFLTDKGIRSVCLPFNEVAALHRETVRIQMEIDKLLEGS